MLSWLFIAAYAATLAASLLAGYRKWDWEPRADAARVVVTVAFGLFTLLAADALAEWLAAVVWLGVLAPLAVRDYRRSRRRVHIRQLDRIFGLS